MEFPKVDDRIFRICPTNNPKGCDGCRWRGCGCPIFMKVYDDGSFHKDEELTVRPSVVHARTIVEIYDWWNIAFFDDHLTAEARLAEFKEITSEPDSRLRKAKYDEFFKKYKLQNPLRRDEKL